MSRTWAQVQNAYEIAPAFSEIFLSAMSFAMIASTSSLLTFFWKKELIACASFLCFCGRAYFSIFPKISSTRAKCAGSTVISPTGFGAGLGSGAGF